MLPLALMASTKKIYILSNFSAYLKSFSPIIVVSEQLKQLTRAGYKPILIACEGWDPDPNSIYSQIETKLLPNANSHSTDDQIENLQESVDLLYQCLKETLPEECVVITHDLIFLPDYTIMNLAARRLAKERPKVRWLHEVHSATGPGTLAQERAMYGDDYANTLNEKFPNSLIMYPNAHDIPRVARNFAFEEFEVVEVPHSTDPIEGLHPLVQRLYDEKKLSEAEVLIIAPMRLDRGKAPQMIVRAVAACEAIGTKAHVVFCDFQSTGGDKVTLREECKLLAKQLGAEDSVTFLSEFDDLAHMEVSHDIILDLFTLSNVFLLPSRSETYSLVAQEAMLRGNLCILNYDFPAFRQIYGKRALYRQFDGAEIAMDGFDGKIDTTHSDIDSYFKERIAIPLKAWLENDKVIAAKTWVRTQRNPDYVFKNYLEPLIMTENEDA